MSRNAGDFCRRTFAKPSSRLLIRPGLPQLTVHLIEVPRDSSLRFGFFDAYERIHH